MIASLVEWLLFAAGFERIDIGRKGYPDYLTRWVLWGKRFGAGHKVYLHRFHRGDVEIVLHDHPWPFWSLILVGGYWEHTPTGKRWYGPLRILKRPAEWAHRVELPAGAKCWTLIWTAERTRGWGFICPDKGWIPWREHEANETAGRKGCES
jgi:hypothetical protein